MHVQAHTLHCTCTHMHTHKHTHCALYVYTHAHIHACTSTHTCTHGHTCTYIQTYIHVHTHAHRCTHMTQTHKHSLCADFNGKLFVLVVNILQLKPLVPLQTDNRGYTVSTASHANSPIGVTHTHTIPLLTNKGSHPHPPIAYQQGFIRAHTPPIATPPSHSHTPSHSSPIRVHSCRQHCILTHPRTLPPGTTLSPSCPVGHKRIHSDEHITMATYQGSQCTNNFQRSKKLVVH